MHYFAPCRSAISFPCLTPRCPPFTPPPSLSRKDCDMNAIKAGQVGPLTNKVDQASIKAEIEALK